MISIAKSDRISDSFDGEGHAVAAAEAQAGDAAFEVPLLQRIDERGEHTRAARANRMPERDGAAVDVDLAGIDAELFQNRDQLARKTLR